MIVPTRLFWWLVAAGIPLAAIGIFVPGFERVLIPWNLALFVLLIVTGLVARGWNILNIERQTNAILSVRVPNLVTLKLENLTDTDLYVRVRDEAPAGCTTTQNDFEVRIPAEQDVELKYTVTPQERGSEEFPGTWVRYKAPLGLAWVQKKFDNAERAAVYPNIRALSEFDLLRQKGRLSLMGVRRSRAKGLGQEFESLRDYHDDDFRLIDWKSTARRGKLVVKNFEQERNQAVIVCLDVGRHMLAEVDGRKKLDYALDAALLLLHTAEKMGDQVGLLIFSDVVTRFIAPKRGRSQVAAILDTVHAIHAEPVQPNYEGAFAYLASRWKRRSLIVVFTDAENESQAAELSSSLTYLNRRHLLMVVRVADPRLRELLDHDIRNPNDLFLRASARWYFNDRRLADRRLVAAGIESIEAEPSELSAALVSSYLRVKSLSLI